MTRGGSSIESLSGFTSELGLNLGQDSLIRWASVIGHSAMVTTSLIALNINSSIFLHYQVTSMVSIWHCPSRSWISNILFFIFCRVTNFLSSWQKFGHDDKKLVAMTIGIVAWPIFCHRDKNLVTMTIGIVAWPIFCHRDKNLVTMTIGIVIVTKNWLRWQLELSSWPKFGHDDQKLVSLFQKWGNPQCFHLPPGFWPMGGLGMLHTPLDHYLTLGQQVVFQSLELQEVPISPQRLSSRSCQ